MLDYTVDSAKDNEPVVFAGDLNTGNDETGEAAVARKLGTLPMPGTSVISGKAIDHFVYRQAKILGTPIIIVLKDSDGSDHSPIISKFDPYQE
ncbi:MAG TPA: hypothetical protein VK534_02235, partial [Methylomirabilota bacterium]|nr:hypothetical protein [Methylomirabilota bacterium]